MIRIVDPEKLRDDNISWISKYHNFLEVEFIKEFMSFGGVRQMSDGKPLGPNLGELVMYFSV